MSQCSSCSYGSMKICRCGLDAKIFTARTRDNAGRRFLKCPKPNSEGCGFWEWVDEKPANRFEKGITDLKVALEALQLENNMLKKKVSDYEASSMLDGRKIRNLEENLFRQCIIIVLMVGCFIGFISAWAVKSSL